MKKTIKFYIALWGAKIGMQLLKLLRRNASFFPGKFALSICPDFMARIDKPKTIIAVTGTNGKTTVCNMIEDVLRDNNYNFIDNKLGSNVNSGIATTFIKGSNFMGKTKKDIAVLEVDERSSNKVYPYITPTYLVCTNLFRDSMLRNAHTEFISEILTKYIPKETKLILNGDDLISSNIAPTNQRVYFGIDRLDTDTDKCINIVNDIAICPKCNSKLNYDFVRYNHIGRAHCSNCDFGSPKIDYEVTNINLTEKKMTMNVDGNEEQYDLITDNIINIYNMVAVIALLRQFGLTAEQVNNSLKKQKIVETRYAEETIKGKKIVTHLAKGMNPIACSRVFDYIKKEPGNKAVILILDDFHDSLTSSENITWHYDADYEFLKDDSIKQIIVTGVRNLDTYVRLQMADVPKERIVNMRDEIDATSHLQIQNVDSIYILYDVYTIHLRDEVKKKVIEIINEKEA
ncbi:MAG: MurT ligase domain-containing protein [Clostridia bacterium]